MPVSYFSEYFSNSEGLKNVFQTTSEILGGLKNVFQSTSEIWKTLKNAFSIFRETPPGLQNVFQALPYSPLGRVSAVPRAMGVPKLGVPSAFQVNFCIRGLRVSPQPWPLSGLAW